MPILPYTTKAVTSGSTTANALSSATTTVDVSAAAEPSANQVLTATDSTHATWQTPAGGSSSPWTMPFLLKTLETGQNTTYTAVNVGSGTSTGDYRRITMSPGTTASSCATIQWDWTPINSWDLYHGTAHFAYNGFFQVVGTDFDMFVGFGDVQPGGAGMASMTRRHIGFRRTKTASGSTVLKCTNGNGTTETTTTVTDPGDTASIVLAAVKTGSSIDYYVNGTKVATHTTNIPSGTVGALPMQIALSNAGVATSSTLYVFNYTYSQQY